MKRPTFESENYASRRSHGSLGKFAGRQLPGLATLHVGHRPRSSQAGPGTAVVAAIPGSQCAKDEQFDIVLWP